MIIYQMPKKTFTFIFCHFKRTDLVDVADGVEAFQVVPFLVDYGAAVVVVGGAKSRFSRYSIPRFRP